MKAGTIGYIILALLGVNAVICAYLLGRMLFG
jgi:hypothetical protein